MEMAAGRIIRKLCKTSNHTTIIKIDEDQLMTDQLKGLKCNTKVNPVPKKLQK